MTPDLLLPGDVVIRVADDPDLEWAAGIMAASEPWITLGRTPTTCRQALRNPDALVFIADACGVQAGFASSIRRGVVGSPYLATLAVAEPWRNRGIGQALVGHVEAYFRPEARHLFLCVSSFNPRARRLYERLGYRWVGELPDYFVWGAAEVLMHKRLRD